METMEKDQRTWRWPPTYPLRQSGSSVNYFLISPSAVIHPGSQILAKSAFYEEGSGPV